MERTEVLILGNGISRLLHKKYIAEWKGELWGCNRVFLEYPKQLTRLTGHIEVLREAMIYRDENKYSFSIWAGHLGAGEKGFKLFSCPVDFRKDSGTTLIAQALEEKWTCINVCGFDLGGKDVHSPGLELIDKYSWVGRWRALSRYYGLGSVHFIGYDHKPFILSNESAKTYSRIYCKRKPHIPDEDYHELYWTFSADELIAEDPIVETVSRDPQLYGLQEYYRQSIARLFEDRGLVEIIGPVNKKHKKWNEIRKMIKKRIKVVYPNNRTVEHRWEIAKILLEKGAVKTVAEHERDVKENIRKRGVA